MTDSPANVKREKKNNSQKQIGAVSDFGADLKIK